MSGDNFYTPDWLVDEILEFYDGLIDLDPSADKNKRIPAINHYTVKENGLALDWRGAIFCNPPYSRSSVTSLDMWVNKALQSYKKYDCEVLLLLPVKTDTKWCQSLLCSSDASICFFRGCIKFLDENYEPSSGTGKFASMLVYLGLGEEDFRLRFCKYGFVKQ